MINIIWPILILFSIIVACFTGKIESVSQAALLGAKDAVTLCVELLGLIAFWNGLMNIALKSGAVEAAARLARPLLKYLFKGLPAGKAQDTVAMNLAANMLGLGNAATPIGLKAMQQMSELNHTPGRATNAMCMFVVLNTASMQLIPTTVIAMRAAEGSSAPAEVVAPVWIASAISVICGIIATKLFEARNGG